MTDYLIDFYSAQGRLYQSERFVARSDADARLEGIRMREDYRPASYKITRLATWDNIVISGTKRPVVRKTILRPRFLLVEKNDERA
jgi:hypothetical protein